MPASTTHPDYDAALPIWTRVRDVLGGSDKVKAKGDLYLPRLTEQETDSYENRYKKRALFFSATLRTLEAMIGFLFRKMPTYGEISVKRFAQDVDMQGTPMAAYCRTVATATASLGRSATVVDWNEEERRPFFVYYETENLVNWEMTRVGGVMKLTMVSLKELVTERGGDEFKPRTVTQYRVFTLTDGVVTVRVFRKRGNEERAATDLSANAGADTNVAEEVVEFYQPMRRGEALSEIPIIIHNSDKPGCEVSKPPLADMSDVNISHYQTSADLENGRHMCATPTAWATGFGKDSKLFLGTEWAWASDEPHAKCGFLEFSGAGLGSLSEGLKEKQDQMAALGARLVEPHTGDAEAYDTVALRASAEGSTLARIGLLVSEGLTEALVWAAWWTATTNLKREDISRDEIYVVLNKDFVSSRMKPDEINALMLAWQQGGMSFETLFWNMQRGEMYEEGTTVEDERALMEANPAIPPVQQLMVDKGDEHREEDAEVAKGDKAAAEKARQDTMKLEREKLAAANKKRK